jgi:hypothetical protein
MAPTGSRNGRRALLLVLQGLRLDMQLANLKQKTWNVIRAEFKNEKRQVKNINSQLRQMNGVTCGELRTTLLWSSAG